jgi:hypothetical protein
MSKTALLAAIMVTASLSSADADELIVRGKSVGPVLLDMSAEELYRALGNPQASNVGDETTSYTYDGLQVGVENSGQRVHRVFATSSKYKLATGISVGSTALAVVATYGEPDERDETPKGDKTFCYGDFELYISEGKVAAILVSKGGCETGFLYYFR